MFRRPLSRMVRRFGGANGIDAGNRRRHGGDGVGRPLVFERTAFRRSCVSTAFVVVARLFRIAPARSIRRLARIGDGGCRLRGELLAGAASHRLRRSHERIGSIADDAGPDRRSQRETTAGKAKRCAGRGHGKRRRRPSLPRTPHSLRLRPRRLGRLRYGALASSRLTTAKGARVANAIGGVGGASS